MRPLSTVPGLEDRADSALAQPAQQLIRTQDQVLGIAVKEGLDLVLGQPFQLDQVLGQGQGIVVMRAQLLRDLVHLLGGQGCPPGGEGSGSRPQIRWT